jgi:uncharacterized membrane protein
MIIHNSMVGASKFSITLVCAGVGILFAFIGNYMPNLKPNYFAGFRLPWTLENIVNWKKTHALAGKLWFGGGILIAVGCLFVKPALAFILLFSVTAIMVVIPAVYSYRLYRQNKTIGSASQPEK